MSKPRLLVVDDEADVAEFVRKVADLSGLEARVAKDHTTFQDDYYACDPDAVITDLQMPGLDGIEVLRWLAGESSRAKVILMSGFDTRVVSSAKRIAASLGLDVVGVAEKPASVASLRSLFSKVRPAQYAPTTDDLGRGIRAGEILVHYQPKACVAGAEEGRVTGAEALARWQHPEHGLLQPGAFIPLAESSDLIVPLTTAVIDAVVAQMGEWRAAGLDLSVAVNLAPPVFDALDFPDRIEETARAAGCDPATLVLEVTESSAMQDTDRTIDIATRLRLKGFELSIDDFGTGFSSLSQLHQMPFSELKVDRSFVMPLADNPDSRTIVRALVDLAHNLDLSVCAEGVEDEFAWRFLRDAGCERAQGFHMSKPLAPEAIPAWIEEWTGESRTRASPSAA